MQNSFILCETAISNETCLRSINDHSTVRISLCICKNISRISSIATIRIKNKYFAIKHDTFFHPSLSFLYRVVLSRVVSFPFNNWSLDSLRSTSTYSRRIPLVAALDLPVIHPRRFYHRGTRSLDRSPITPTHDAGKRKRCQGERKIIDKWLQAFCFAGKKNVRVTKLPR